MCFEVPVANAIEQLNLLVYSYLQTWDGFGVREGSAESVRVTRDTLSYAMCIILDAAGAIRAQDVHLVAKDFIEPCLTSLHSTIIEPEAAQLSDSIACWRFLENLLGRMLLASTAHAARELIGYIGAHQCGRETALAAIDYCIRNKELEMGNSIILRLAGSMPLEGHSLLEAPSSESRVIIHSHAVAGTGILLPLQAPASLALIARSSVWSTLVVSAQRLDESEQSPTMRVLIEQLGLPSLLTAFMRFE